MSQPKPLSQPRFEALLYRRSPIIEVLFRELEWWSTEDVSLIAVLAEDRVDEGFGYVILGRDETGVFRGVAPMTSIETRDDARTAMFEKMAELSKGGDQVFPQEDNNRKKHEILVPCVPDEKLHPNFKILMGDDGYTPARGIIKELSFAFTDLDGNYRKDFQTQNFDSRLWELYLYAAFYTLRFYIDDEHAVPDFILEGPDGKIAVEAVTVNPTKGGESPLPKTAAEEEELCRDYMPVKWGSPLFSKLKMKYWEQEHIRDMPLVFAIHDFHAPGSMVWSLPALSDCLFGVRCGKDGKDCPVGVYKRPGKGDIPAGFFRQPEAENVSAVLASNEATLAKFNRMGKIAGFGNPEIIIGRQGVMLDLNANKAGSFRSRTEVGRVDESWSHGLWVFHNPNAKDPLSLNFFPGALNVFLSADGQRNYRSARRYHILRSNTYIFRT